MAAATTAHRVYLHFRWPLSADSAPFSLDVLGRLGPYLTRYGQTLGATVFAVGGGVDHLHLLLQLPPTRSAHEIETELQAATVRFVRDVLNVQGFAWHENDGGFIVSCGSDAPDKMNDYLRQNWERHATGAVVSHWEGIEAQEPETNAVLPEWLRDALKTAGGDKTAAKT